MITLVVFSKDRAMQLDSLLRSVEDHCTGIDRTIVIAKATSPLHDRAYVELGKHYVRSMRHLWTDSPSMLGTLPVLGRLLHDAIVENGHPDHVAFAVDDMIFYRPSDFTRASTVLNSLPAFVWSWRHGAADRLDAVRAGADFWRGPAGYAWHVDGSVYLTTDYTRTLDRYYSDWRTQAKTPNDLEGVVAARAEEWSGGLTHVGPLEATCMTWQINQAHATPGVRRAPFASIPATQLDALAEAYLAGRRVDNQKLYDDLSWTTRFQKRARQEHVEACEEAAAFYASCIR